LALVLDTGPLYAAIDRADAYHAVCRRLLDETTETLVVPSPVLVEVDYWISQRLHPGVFVALLDEIVSGGLVVEDLVGIDYLRARSLCDRYADSDIGFVDAAVLAIVERLDEPKLATLDHRHFAMMRPRHVDALRLLPE
jgi:predicted nucleic acid-binding protein